MTISWFGLRGAAPMFEEIPEVDTPVGQECFACDEPIAEEDDGVVLPYLQGDGVAWVAVPEHVECYVRSIVGSVAHMEGRCSCHGGTHGDDDDELFGGSYRADAKEVLRRLRAQGEGEGEGEDIER